MQLRFLLLLQRVLHSLWQKRWPRSWQLDEQQVLHLPVQLHQRQHQLHLRLQCPCKRRWQQEWLEDELRQRLLLHRPPLLSKRNIMKSLRRHLLLFHEQLDEQLLELVVQEQVAHLRLLPLPLPLLSLQLLQPLQDV